MEPKSPDRTKSTVSPNKNLDDKDKAEDDDYVPKQMNRKGKTTTLKNFINDDLKNMLKSKKNFDD